MKFIHLVTVFSLFFLHTPIALAGRDFGCESKELEKRDAAPVAGADGICFTYTVQQGDTCVKIAENHSVSISDIDRWNTGSWEWKGCTNIMQGDFVCLSSGALPMPVAFPNAVCGPRMPGSVRPENYADLASMNPCLSGQCCSRWYQCGNSSAFCSLDKGCLSNCGGKSISKQVMSEPSPSQESTSSKDTITSMRTTSATSTTKEMVTITSVVMISPLPTWVLTLYENSGCDDGNYFSLQGNEKIDHGSCINLKVHTQTDISDDKTSCRWWTDEGLKWSTCSSSTLTRPKSWYLKAGACWVYSDDHCGEWAGRIDIEGCGKPRMSLWSPDEFVSLKCWDNSPFGYT